MKFVKKDTGEEFNGVYAYCVEIIEETWSSMFIVTGVRTEDGAIKKVKTEWKKQGKEIEENAYISSWRFVLPNRGIAQLA